MRKRWFAALGLALVLVVAGGVAAHRAAKPADWPADGYVYARMMLIDTGLSEDDAHAAESRHFGWSAAPRDAGARGAYEPGSSRWYAATRGYPLFRSRPLYPRLAALLYPRFGYGALRVVSGAGVVVTAVALYVLLLLVAPWWLAACGSVAIASAFGEQMGLPLTDGLATALWTAALASTALYARRPGWGALSVAVVCAALLALTRPEPWLPVGAAAGFLVAAWRGGAGLRRTALVLFASQCAIALGGALYTAAVHGPGLATLMHWQYDWVRDEHGAFAARGFAAWYALTLVRNIALELASLVLRGFPVLALAVAALGIIVLRRNSLAAVLLGAACAANAAFLATMNPADLARVWELPLVPVVATAFVAALAPALRAALSERLGQRVEVAEGEVRVDR